MRAAQTRAAARGGALPAAWTSRGLHYVHASETLTLVCVSWDQQLSASIARLPTVLRCSDLHASGNDGALPSELGQLTALTYMYEPRLPARPYGARLINTPCASSLAFAAYGACPVARRRGIAYNGFTGTLPSELGRWTALTSMYAPGAVGASGALHALDPHRYQCCPSLRARLDTNAGNCTPIS